MGTIDGKKIKDFRKKANLSQNKLAKLVFVSRQSISSWENEITSPTDDNLKRLAEIFSIDITDFYFDNINKKKKLNINWLKIRQIVICCLIFLIISIFIFLLYFFLITYKQIKVYTISSDFTNIDGIFIVSKNKSYMHAVILDDIDKATLYYKDSLIYYSDENYISFNDLYGYNEYFSYNELDEFINNLYLEVHIKDEKYKSKLNFSLDSENDKLLYFKSPKSYNTINDGTDNDITIPKNIKENFLYAEGNYYLSLKEGSKKINLFYIPDINQFSITENGNPIFLFYLNDDIILYQSFDKNNKLIDKQEMNINDNNDIVNNFKSKYYYKYIMPK